jgi:hypothetical protein
MVIAHLRSNQVTLHLNRTHSGLSCNWKLHVLSSSLLGRATTHEMKWALFVGVLAGLEAAPENDSNIWQGKAWCLHTRLIPTC